MKMEWEQWWGEVKRLYAEPCTTYDGMIYLLGSPPADAVKATYTPTPEKVEEWANTPGIQEMFRDLYEAGDDPETASNAMI